jgi:NAD-dependent dihydropyrimidine dehydrogenase PreA subunit
MDGEEKAVVLDIGRCTWCCSCELHCPDLAIEILAAEAGESG